MADTNIASAGIVREVLTSDNYLNWSALVKNYLIGKKLWDIITKADPTRHQQNNIAEGNLDPTGRPHDNIVEVNLDCTGHPHDNIVKVNLNRSNTYPTWRQKNNIVEKGNLDRSNTYPTWRQKNNIVEEGNLDRTGRQHDNIDDSNTYPTGRQQDNIVEGNPVSNELQTNNIGGVNSDPTRHQQNNIADGNPVPSRRQQNNIDEDNPDPIGPQQSNIVKDADWPSRNAQALHAIQLSCGNYALSQIRDLKSAKEAWNHLKHAFSDDLEADNDIEQGDSQSYSIDRFHGKVKKGMLKYVIEYIKNQPTIVNEKSSLTGWNALHVAVDAGQYEMMMELVDKGVQQITEENWDGYTPFALGAKSTDDIQMVKQMLDTVGDKLLGMGIKDIGDKGDIPVILAATKGHKKMTKFLFDETKKTSLLVDHDYYYGAKLLSHCIQAEIFDVAESLLQEHDKIPLTYKSDQCARPIYGLAHIPTAFPSGTRFKLWEWISAHLCCIGNKKMYEIKKKQSLADKILKCFCEKIEKKSSESELHQWSVRDAMLQAAKCGIIEFINSMRIANPDLLWVTDSIKRGIFAHAILNRQSKVFKLISEIKGQKGFRKSVDMFGNNLLHLAAELGPSSYQRRRSNAALQMQRDLKWFKAVESIVPMMYKEAKNADGLKPREVFTKNHVQLINEGRKWAKETASSFTIVGTLIITIMFAAAFTVPGGNDQAKGTPFFLGKDAFSVFILADALSLIASSSSVLMFIGILTSRYAEEDFHRRLPLKLLFALFTIFLSVLSMMVAFGSGLALMLKGYRWIIITGIASSILPIIVLLGTLMRLFYEICHSLWNM